MPFSRRCSTAWISFFARDRERTSCWRLREAAAQDPAALVRHPHRLKLTPATTGRARVRASSRSVFARARSDPGVIRADHDHPVHLPLAGAGRPPSNCPSPPTRPDQTATGCPPAAPSPLRWPGTRPAERTFPSSQIAMTEESRWTSRPIARPTHLANGTAHLPTRLTVQRENQRDNDTDRYELEAQSKQVAGAAERKARARSPSIKTAYPTAFSQRRPLSWMGRNLGPGPDRASERQFHASITRAAPCGSRDTGLRIGTWVLRRA